MIETIERIHQDHFEFLPRKRGCLIAEMDGIKIINCGLASSMFNIVYGNFKNPCYICRSKIQDVITCFKGQPFAWWVPGSTKNPTLTTLLLEAGFTIETTEYAMICDLRQISTYHQKTELSIRQVRDMIGLHDFLCILEPYDPAARAFYAKIDLQALQTLEKLFVGYSRGNPVVIGVLFSKAVISGIFSLITTEVARGKGFATDMMGYLLEFAKGIRSNQATLSASSDSGYRIYQRLGFKSLGEFECFEYKKDLEEI